jgi:hypothetical protein
MLHTTLLSQQYETYPVFEEGARGRRHIQHLIIRKCWVGLRLELRDGLTHLTAVFVKVEPTADGNLEKKGLPKPMIYSAR